MTDAADLIAEVDALLAAATPGPWHAAIPPEDAGTRSDYVRETFTDPDGPASGCHTVWIPSTRRDGKIVIVGYTGDGPTSERNAALIARAPGLLAELRDALQDSVQGHENLAKMAASELDALRDALEAAEERSAAAMRLTDGYAQAIEGLAARAEKAEVERDWYREACVDLEHGIQYILASALGYPEFQPGEPGFSEDRTNYNIGDHTATSLAMEAASRLRLDVSDPWRGTR